MQILHRARTRCTGRTAPGPERRAAPPSTLTKQGSRARLAGQTLGGLARGLLAARTLRGPVRLIVKLLQCRNAECDCTKVFSPEQEAEYAMPRWGIGWDVFCWMGQRRFARHWSVCQIRHELTDSYDIPLSDDAIEGSSLSRPRTVAPALTPLTSTRGMSAQGLQSGSPTINNW